MPWLWPITASGSRWNRSGLTAACPGTGPTRETCCSRQETTALRRRASAASCIPCRRISAIPPSSTGTSTTLWFWTDSRGNTPTSTTRPEARSRSRWRSLTRRLRASACRSRRGRTSSRAEKRKARWNLQKSGCPVPAQPSRSYCFPRSSAICSGSSTRCSRASSWTVC